MSSSELTRGQKISAALTGRTFSDDHRAAISQSLTGKPKSAESNARRREAARAYWAAKRMEGTVNDRG